MEKVSIVVPVYNIEKFLPQCVENLINQTYKNIEILLVDDGSKDKSGGICDMYAAKDSRIVVLHKPNGGVSSARNLGLDNARGSWITFCDADDWIETDTVELLIKKAEQEKADIIFCDFWFDYPDKKIEKKFYDWNKTGNKGLQEYIATTWTCLCGSMQRKRLYDENNLRSEESISYCEDFHLIVRLCYFAEKIAKVSRPLYHYRQQESSIMHNLSKKTEADEMWAYADIIRFFKEQNVYEDFKRVMAWRSLKASQELALNSKTFDNFCAYNPDKKDFIISCPFIGKKLKTIMWCLTHGLRPVSLAIVNARKILGR